LLIISDQIIKDTKEKAKLLQQEVLKRFDTADNLEYNPLNNWDRTSKLS
jgi:hypothetical protein